MKGREGNLSEDLLRLLHRAIQKKSKLCYPGGLDWLSRGLPKSFGRDWKKRFNFIFPFKKITVYFVKRWRSFHNLVRQKVKI